MQSPTVTRTLGLFILPPNLNYNENSQLKPTTALPTRPEQRSFIYNRCSTRTFLRVQLNHFFIADSIAEQGLIFFVVHDGLI